MRSVAPAAPRLPIALTAATSFGFLLVQLDVSIVNVALGAIDGSLRAGVSGLQWVVDAYALVFASFLLLAGSLGDRIGSRQVFLVGFALFLFASAACGLAPSIGGLVAARLVQGVGAALMVPSSLAILNAACAHDADLRHRAVGLWTAAGSVGLALGPVLGGTFVSIFGWRSIFLVNLPIGALGIWLTLRAVPPASGGGGRFDWPGQALAILVLFSLVGAAIEAGSQGWTSWPVLGGFALSAAAAGAFVAVESRQPQPMLPLGFFRAPAFGAALVVGIAVNLTVYGTLFLVSLVLQQVRGETPAETGWVFLPATVAVGVANVLAGQIAGRVGTGRLMAAGLLAAAAGFGVLRGIDPQMPIGLVVLGLVLMGAGIGTAVPAMTSSLLASVPKESGGVAAGVLNTVRQAAGAVGVAVFGTLFATDAASGPRWAMTGAAAICLVGIAAATVAARGRRSGPG